MKIKSGRKFTLLLTDRGEVYSWGNNNSGKLGIGIRDKYYHKPTMIKFQLDIPIRYISVGDYHAAAIDYEYNVYIWGFNNSGRLGLGHHMDIYSPTIIEKLTEKKIEKIYCNCFYTVALSQNGEVYFWGTIAYGRIKSGDNYVNTPIKLNFPNNTIIKKLYTGDNHMYGIDTFSKIYSWGYQLCNGDNIDNKSPFIATMLKDFNINKIVCLTSSTIILADNKLYFIEYNNDGELGLSIDETNKITLIADGVDNVWGKNETVFYKMISGDIYVWGNNNEGQLGIGNKLDQNTPVKLNMALDIKSINYYGGVTYAITTSGDIYTWGKNKLIRKEHILEPTSFTYFLDNCIEIRTMNRTKSAKKIDY